MRWEAFSTYCDDVSAIIDALDTPPRRHAMLDAAELTRSLTTDPAPGVAARRTTSPATVTRKAATRGTARS